VLKRYRVLDLTDDRGHLCGMILAQMGAEVIAVEPPGGSRSRSQGPFNLDGPKEEQSLTYAAYNRGKKSIIIDLATDAGREALETLAAGADALIESGAQEIDIEGLCKRHPHLVTASISPYGSTGPKAGWAGTDITNTAASGTMGLTGDRDRAPVRLSLPQTWHFAAGDALCAILLGLRERDRSGLGQQADISAQQSYLSATQFQMLYPFVDAPSTKRLSGGMEIGPITLRVVYKAKDGFVNLVFLVGPTVGPYTIRLFKWVEEEGMCPEELCDVDWVGFGAQLTSDPKAPELLNRGGEVLQDFIATKTKAELLAGSLSRNLILVPVMETDELLDLDHFLDRDYWSDIEGLKYPGPVSRPMRTPMIADVAPPKLNQHANEILKSDENRVPAISVNASKSWSGAPLEGVKVLDLTWAIAGPYTARMMADFGAEVIRIESESKPCIMRGAGPFMNDEPGAENSLSYHSINASKMSLAIDLRRPESKEIMEGLVKWADVLIESYSVGVIDRIGLGYDNLKKINDKLIMVSTSLMGQTGALRNISGFGNIGASVAGFYPFGGWPDRAPCGPFAAYSDFISPRFTAATILGALDHRDHTGEGQYIDYSQMEGAVHLLSPGFLDQQVNGVRGTRIGNRDANMAPHGAYSVAGEDKWLALACENDEQWWALAELLGRNDLAGLSFSERVDRHDEIDSVIGDWAGLLAGEKAEFELQKVGVPAHRVLYAPDVVNDVQMKHRGAFAQVAHEKWEQTWIEENPIHLSRTPGSAKWAAPTFGEHLFPILTGILGHTEDEAAELIATGMFI
jgi:crotonobetainyl-CoA:carnitine CoA-transferase CaiB-like acyl-CoA transferase